MAHIIILQESGGSIMNIQEIFVVWIYCLNLFCFTTSVHWIDHNNSYLDIFIPELESAIVYVYTLALW